MSCTEVSKFQDFGVVETKLESHKERYIGKET